MKAIFNDDELLYGIKYKVSKLDKNNFLMFPMKLVKGYEQDNCFKTETEIIPYVQTKADLKNRYVVDTIFNIEELEYVYSYEDEDEECLIDYFYEEHKDVALLVNCEDENCLSKIDFNYKKIADQSVDSVFCMDKSIPAVILNEKAITELKEAKKGKEFALVLEKYKEKLNSFKDKNLNDKVTRIYVSNGKLEYIDTRNAIDNIDFNKKINTLLNRDEDLEDGKEEKIDDTGISYNGLRNYIKERVYGHDEEIDTFAQKIYMNYTAMENETIDSILFVGPTGTGKTETVKAACEYLDLPSFEVNASNIVPQGIKGMSIEDVIIGLYESAGRSVKKAERGIIFLDEFDKLNDTDLELKGPVKNILLTFTAGGIFPIDSDRYKFNFNSSKTTKIYAGVFDKISEKIKSLGFNNILEFNEILKTDEEIRNKIIDKKYFTLEELSRISTILAYNELDRETKKKIITTSKLSEYIKKKERYKRQFKIDLEAEDSYIEELLDSLDKDSLGMRSINNYLKRTLNEVEKSILEGNTKGHKKLILTKDTVIDPKNFKLK